MKMKLSGHFLTLRLILNRVTLTSFSLFAQWTCYEGP